MRGDAILKGALIPMSNKYSAMLSPLRVGNVADEKPTAVFGSHAAFYSGDRGVSHRKVDHPHGESGQKRRGVVHINHLEHPRPMEPDLKLVDMTPAHFSTLVSATLPPTTTSVR